MISNQQQIGTEQLIRLALQCLPHTVGEETNCRKGAHGHDQRRDQQMQLAGPRITA
jgi:hypothetical protein